MAVFLCAIVVASRVGASEALLDGISPRIDPAGTRLAYLAYDTGSKSFNLWLVSITGHERRMLDQGLDATQLTWSDDGTRLAYAKRSDGVLAVAVLDVTTGARREIPLPDGAPPVAVAGLTSTRVVIGTGATIAVADLRTGRMRRVLDFALRGLRPDFSSMSMNAADEIVIAARGASSAGRALWIVAIHSKQRPRRITAGTDDASPVWRDEHTVLFSRSAKSGATPHRWERHLWMKQISGNAPAVQLTHGASIDIEPAVAADHKTAVFVRIAPPALAGGNEQLGTAAEILTSGLTALVDFASAARILPLPLPPLPATQ